MSSLWAPSNVYIVNILHKSFQYGINVRGNIQIKMFQRSSQINVRFTNRSRVFGFFLPWSRCWYILINVDMTPDKKIHTLNIRSFTETKSPHFLHPLSDDRLPSVWGASVTLSPHQQLMTPGPCSPAHICTHPEPSMCPALHDYPRSNTKYLRDKNHPWPGSEEAVIILEITDMVRVALDCATSIRKGLLWKVALSRATSTLTTDAESAQVSTRPVSWQMSEFAHVPPSTPPFDPLITHFTTGQRQAELPARPGPVLTLQNVVGHDHWTEHRTLNTPYLIPPYL